jgi:hypothetical protein
VSPPPTTPTPQASKRPYCEPCAASESLRPAPPDPCAWRQSGSRRSALPASPAPSERSCSASTGVLAAPSCSKVLGFASFLRPFWRRMLKLKFKLMFNMRIIHASEVRESLTKFIATNLSRSSNTSHPKPPPERTRFAPCSALRHHLEPAWAAPSRAALRRFRSRPDNIVNHIPAPRKVTNNKRWEIVLSPPLGSKQED